MNEVFRLAPAEWAQLRALLDEALALPAGERAAWLERLGARHAALGPRLAAYRASSPVSRYRALHAAGVVRRLQGDPDAARALQREAQAALPDVPVHRPRRDTVHAELARLALAQGDAQAALEALQRLSRAPGAGGAHGPDEAERLATLGEALLALGRPQEGRAALARAADVAVAALASPSE